MPVLNKLAHNDISVQTTRKVRNRIIPLLFLLYIVAFLDRVNIGFAALTMNAALAITNAQFGLLTGIFFWGYFLFEIPSNLFLHKIGARIWIARILISWGDRSNTYWSCAERAAAVCRSLLARRCGGWLLPRHRSVPDVLVPAT